MLSNANYVDWNDVVHVTHPEHYETKESWYWRPDIETGWLNFQNGAIFNGNVNREDVERIANHDQNEYEIVNVSESPFDGYDYEHLSD